MFNALIYGDSGTGKSWVGVNLIDRMGGHGLILDCERSVSPYSDRFKFHVEDVNNPFHTRERVRELLDSPVLPGGEPCHLLVIDPITMFRDDLASMADEFQRGKTGLTDHDIFKPAMNQALWGRLTALHKGLFRDLRRMDIPLIVTAREREIRSDDGSRVLGYRADADKNIKYWFDIVIRMTRVGQTYLAEVEKDRSGKLPPIIDQPVHDILFDTYPEAWGHRPESRSRPSMEAQDEFDTLTAQYSPQQILPSLRKYGVDRFQDLTPEKAEEILAKLRGSSTEETDNQPQPQTTR